MPELPVITLADGRTVGEEVFDHKLVVQAVAELIAHRTNWTANQMPCFLLSSATFRALDYLVRELPLDMEVEGSDCPDMLEAWAEILHNYADRQADAALDRIKLSMPHGFRGMPVEDRRWFTIAVMHAREILGSMPPYSETGQWATVLGVSAYLAGIYNVYLKISDLQTWVGSLATGRPDPLSDWRALFNHAPNNLQHLWQAAIFYEASLLDQ